MIKDIITLLQEQGEDAKDSGFTAWGNAMLLAAKEIEKLRDEIKTHNDKLSREKLILDSLND